MWMLTSVLPVSVCVTTLALHNADASKEWCPGSERSTKSGVCIYMLTGQQSNKTLCHDWILMCQ